MNLEKEQEQRSDVNRVGASLVLRQSFLVPLKIAFWAALVGSLASIGGIVTLSIVSGGAGQSSVISMACWIACAIILAIRIRWMPLLSTLLGGVILILLALQPYVTESLANPKTDPNGGFGHFVGDIVIITCALIMFTASIASVQQNYRLNSWNKTRRWFSTALSIIAGITIGALLIGALAQPVVALGTTYTNGIPTVHMSTDSFNQSSVTIAKGSLLLLVDDTSAVHILSNGSWQNNTPKPGQESGAPVVNNVLVHGNSSTELGPFTIAGTYHIYCTVHAGMNLTVIVQ